MFRNAFDPKKPLRYARYGRMSSDKQNPRSPEQQFAEIDKEIARQEFVWVHVGDYRDNGISGRLMRKRPGLQKLLSDIRSGCISIDAILVDTFERFGRADELTPLRQELMNRQGVFLLTADSHFADPTTAQGKALGFVEQIRSTEETRIKARQVFRGKRDAVLLKHWPGGTWPFGFLVEYVFITRNGRQELDYAVLKPNPATAWIIQRLFNKARETGWGQDRLTHFLNNDPEIPDIYKPFHPGTVGSWLGKAIYYGTYRWNEFCTDVVDDRRIEQRNPEDEVFVVEDYCEAIVSRETWEAVNALRRRRGDGIRRAQAAKAAAAKNGKQIAPLVTGMSVKYVLAGLVRCGECGRAMTPMASSPYTAKNGERRKYVHYHCPASPSGVCLNRTWVPEKWLRQVVINCLLGHRFSDDAKSDAPSMTHGNGQPHQTGEVQLWNADQLGANAQFRQLVEEVQKELDRRLAEQPDVRAALEQEAEALRKQTNGWSQTLANPELAAAVRREIEADFSAALSRLGEIEQQITADSALRESRHRLVTAEEVAERLNRLDSILANGNPSLTNLELSQHIEGIRCFSGGQVILRICKVGIIPDVLPILKEREATEETPPPVTAAATTTRRRTRLNVYDASRDHAELDAALEFATDLNRFAGLDVRWFWTDEFQVPKRLAWSEEHALEVRAYRNEHKCSQPKLVEHFKKSKPTIRRALQIAETMLAERKE